jgi:hypothetical protein
VLEAAGSRISVQSILNDEEAHLDEMQERLQSGQPEWRTQLEQVMLVEQRAFSGLLDAFDAAVTSHR